MSTHPDLNRRDFLRIGLSVESVAKRGRPIDFPDFTRGRWRDASPLPIVLM